MNSPATIKVSIASNSSVYIEELVDLELGKLLANISPENAIKRISLLFNQCSVAQQVAASTAVESAIGNSINLQLFSLRSFLVKLESFYHTLWLVLIELPKSFDIAIDWEFFRQLSRGLLTQLSDQINTKILGISPTLSQIDECSSKLLDSKNLDHLNNHLQACRTNLGSEERFSKLVAHLKTIDWKVNQRTNFNNIGHEGYINRHASVIEQSEYRLNGLFEALLIDLDMQIADINDAITKLINKQFQANIHQNDWVGKVECEKLEVTDKDVVCSSARVEISRGCLQHNVELIGSNPNNWLVYDWQILAPTKQNFSKGNIAEAWLNELLNNDFPESELITRAETLLKLLNPCYLVKVNRINTDNDIVENAHA